MLGAIAGALVGAMLLGMVPVVLGLMNGHLSSSERSISVLVRLGALCGSMLGGTLRAGYAWHRREG